MFGQKYVDDPSGVNPEAVYAETNFALSDAKMQSPDRAREKPTCRVPLIAIITGISIY